jgi:carbon storage regulator CsrA
MLVLSRKIGEEIVIGRVTCVRILRMFGNRVFLAIEAPNTVSIDRKEIWLAKERERLAADERERALVTGPDRTRQDTLDCVAGRAHAPVGDSIARKPIPMLKRVASEDRPEENRAERYDHRRILRLGIPLGSQAEAASFRAALVRLLADSQDGDGPTIEFCNDLTTDTLRAELQSVVLAIVLELLHNARRHSKSADILLGITRDDDGLCVQVEDWGVGFDVQREQSRGLGLKGIRHLVRWLGGTIEIDSQLGTGTCVIVEVPLFQETGTNHPTTGLKPR